MKILLAALIAGAPALALAQSNPMVSDRDRAAARTASPSSAQVRRGAGGPDLAGAPSVALTGVVIEGASVPADQAWRPFVGRPLDGPTIRAVADAVSRAYETGPVALYTVQVPDQSFQGGVLRLRVIEGHISEVVLHGETEGDQSLVRAYGEKLTAERPLTRRSLQRYVSLIRDIPGLETDVELLAGDEPGAVKLGLGLDQTRHEINLSVNTRGAPLLGRTQLQAEWAINGALRQGDQTRLTAIASSDFERLLYGSLTHSTPLGSDGLRMQGQIGHLRTRPNTGAKGEATLAGVVFSYPLIRGYNQDLYVSAGLDGINADNAVFGQTAASERTRVARGSVSYGASGPAHAMALTLTGSAGLDGMGARINPLLAEAEFRKLVAQAGFDFAMSPAFELRLRALGQFTSDPLPSSEQFALGGDTLGRGFPSSLLLGDEGGGGSVELAWTQRRDGVPTGTEVYAFADTGEVTLNPRPVLPAGASDNLSSAGAGVRIGVGRYRVGLEAARPLQRPAGYADDDWRLVFSLNRTR